MDRKIVFVHVVYRIYAKFDFEHPSQGFEGFTSSWQCRNSVKVNHTSCLIQLSFRRCFWYWFLVDFEVLLCSILGPVWATLTDPFCSVGSKNRAPPLAHVLLVLRSCSGKAFSAPPRRPLGPTCSDMSELGDVVMVNGGLNRKPTVFD